MEEAALSGFFHFIYVSVSVLFRFFL